MHYLAKGKMVSFPNITEDPFILSKLNPLFLENLKNYWNTLKNATVSEEARSQINEAFYNLIRFTFRRLFQPLYLKHSLKLKGTLFLLSAVHSDGIGDYIATLKCAQLLKEHHPEIDAQVVYTHKQKLPAPDFTFSLLKKENINAFHETTDPSSQILGHVLEGKTEFSFLHELEKMQQEKQNILLEYEALKNDHPQAAAAIKDLADEMDKPIKQLQYFSRKKIEAEHLYERMKESLALIHIALALNTFDNPALASKSLYFAESGNFQGIANYLQRNWFSMGLDPFEEGIFLQKQKTTSQWIDVKLPRFLWGAEQPDNNQIERYSQQYSLHLGYLPRISEQRSIFIEMICRRHIQDKRHIDILLPKPENKTATPSFDRNWLVAYGISKVIEVESENEFKERPIIEIDLPSEKYLRLIYALPVPPSDFINLIDLSGEIIGCTGDGSLSDCIIAGKIPFYEVRRHKLRTLEAFKRLARVLTLPDVLEYFEQLILFADWPAQSFMEKFESLLSDGSFRLQWKTLVDFIKRYYCFEDSFISHVNRQLFVDLSWEIKEKEERLIQAYFEKAISSENAFETYEKILKNRSPSL